LAPVLGAVCLTKLRSRHIAEAYAKALANGRRDGKGGLSASTVVYMHRVLKQALAQAVAWRELVRNEAGAVKPPQTKAGIRYKPPKSGKGRTVALPKSVVDELRNHRIRQAEALSQARHPTIRRCLRDRAGRRQPASAAVFNARFRTVLSQTQAAAGPSA